MFSLTILKQNGHRQKVGQSDLDLIQDTSPCHDVI